MLFVTGIFFSGLGRGVLLASSGRFSMDVSGFSLPLVLHRFGGIWCLPFDDMRKDKLAPFFCFLSVCA